MRRRDESWREGGVVESFGVLIGLAFLWPFSGISSTVLGIFLHIKEMLKHFSLGFVVVVSDCL